MELRELVRTVRRKWWLVMAFSAFSMGIAALVSWMTVHQYATSLTFFVTTPNQKPGASYQGDPLSQQRARSYAIVLAGDKIASVIADGEIGLTSSEVQHRISAEAQPQMALLKAVVTDDDQARSKRLAADVARLFPAYVAELEMPPGDSVPAFEVVLVTGPQPDTPPADPRLVRNLALGAAVGLLGGIAIAALRNRSERDERADAG